MLKVRTRFAPSPTGYLHIGSLRTALFAYLIAKSLGGKLILRIEDTDVKRQVKGAEEKLIEILNWIGIKFDEGPHIGGKYGPYIQGQRLDIYSKYAKQLLDSGQAYRCFCSAKRLEKMRQDQQAQKLPPRYDRRCRDLDENEIKTKLKNNKKFVIRQKMPLTGEVVVHDELREDIKFRAKDLEDHVLIKSNGRPTYQFACPVDDHLMGITQVIRGEEWIPSFPKNVLLYQAFGWSLPKFIHLPLILNKEGGKLSKRQGDVAVEDYKAKGYLPEVLVNFCALLGWSPYANLSAQAGAIGDKASQASEVISLDEIIKIFKIKDMGISPAVFDSEKLDYLNGYYIRQKSLDELVKLARPYLIDNLKKTADKGRQTTKFVKNVLRLEQKRLKKLSDIGELTEFFFTDKIEFPVDLLIWQKMTKKQVKENLQKVSELLEKIPLKHWTDNSIKDAITSYLEAKELKVGEYLWPMRVALTGRKGSPGPFEVAEVLGKKVCLERIKEAMEKL